MSDIGKGMLIIMVILYIVSPIDFAPGPVDDATLGHNLRLQYRQPCRR